ncbi:MAG: right-handed parallel beta-helix repeat-containing protein, partial [Verrucomicrobiota bacterium]|nr:right-handed parallel beta-helix repeat-containing protein [Verrucomicrobiota bacterium]
GVFCGAPNSICERLSVSSNGGSGIEAWNSTVRDCQAQLNNSLGGISALSSTVSGCLVQSSAVSGIFVFGPGSQIIGNTCIGNNTSLSASDAGIYINDSNNRIEGNHVTASGSAGIRVNDSFFTNNVVIKNTVAGNGANNYLGTNFNDFGPIGTAAASTSPWANISH